MKPLLSILSDVSFVLVIVVMIPDKITSRRLDIDYEKLKEELGESYKTGIQRISKSPKQKYPYPVTSSQELGWEPALPGLTKKFCHPRTQCIETKYADNYINMSHSSPYASQQKAKAKI